MTSNLWLIIPLALLAGALLRDLIWMAVTTAALMASLPFIAAAAGAWRLYRLGREAHEERANSQWRVENFGGKASVPGWSSNRFDRHKP